MTEQQRDRVATQTDNTDISLSLVNKRASRFPDARIDNLPTKRQSRRQSKSTICAACRRKRVKCSKTQPCNSCRRRDTECVYEQYSLIRDVHEPEDTLQLPALSANQTATVVADGSLSRARISPIRDDSVAQSEDSTFLLRMKRLEDAVFGESIAQLHTTRTTETPSLTAQSPAAMETRSRSQARLVSQRQILPRTAELSSPALTISTSTNVVLPPKALTLAYIEQNLARINALTMVLDTTTFLQKVQELYYKQGSGQQDPNDLGLFFSVLSSGLHYWPPSVGIVSLLSMKESIASTTVRLLEENQVTRTPTLSLLQAMIIFMPILLTMSGTTYLTQASCHERIISIARRLSLSRIDIKVNQEKHNPLALSTEIRRRIWWFITATDWILSHMSGPQEYSYLIHPNHIRVNLPKHIDIEDWGARNSIEKPLSEPTQMSFFIMRYKFSLICKDITDALAQDKFYGTEADYQIVIDLGQRLQNYLDKLPDFFKLQPRDYTRFEQLGRRYPYILWQRSLLQIIIHTRICRLHQPYTRRGTTMPKYSYSRMACLRSARIVLETVEQIIDEELPPAEAPIFVRMWTVLHHTLVAGIVLLADFAQNPREPGFEHRRREIERSKAVLGRAKEESDLARKGFEFLNEGLRKFGGGDGIGQDGERTVDNFNGTDEVVQRTENESIQPDIPSNLWKRFGDETAMDNDFWTAVYLDLDQFIVD